MKPPRLAVRLLRAVASERDRLYLLADLQEEFERISCERGARAARRWYWRQSVASAWPLLAERTARALRVGAAARPSLRTVATDVVQAGRWISRHRAIAGTVVATLTVTFASALAAFTIVNAVILRPLPFPSADCLVEVRVTGPTLPAGVRSSSRPNFEDWRQRSRTFAALGAYAPVSYRLTNRGEPANLDAIRVTEDFQRVLGLRAQAGRLLTTSDFGPSPTVAVLTAAYWRREFGADPAVVGRTLVLDGQAHEIVGVLPDLDVQYPADPHAIWVPLVPRPGAFWEQSRNSGWLFAVGRLHHAVSVEQARAELTTIARTLALEHPDANRERTDAELTSVADVLVGPVTPVLTLIAAALGMVLLIGCGNIATLLLASASKRRREFALRTALGAAGGRLTRQIVGETALLSLMAGVSAVWLSPLLVRGFLALYPASLPRTVAPGPDATTIAAALLLSLLATVFLAVPQAARACRPNVNDDLTPGARTTETRGDRSVRAVLVGAQVALSFVLIVAGVAFLRTLDRLVRVDTGYRAENVMTFNVSPPPTATSGAGVLRFYDAAVESIRGVPGVRSAAAAVAVPLTSSGWAFGVREPGTTADVLVGVNLASAMYFDALGIRLVEGRLLTDAEQRSGTDVAIVNAPLARVLGGQVVGSSLRYSGTSWRVVGVVDGVRHRQPRTPPAPELFIPWHLAGRRPQAIIVRSQSDPLPLLSVIASRIREIDPTAPLSDVARLEDRRQEATSGERFRAVLVAFLGAVAVALAVLGTYSVTAYSVARRRREYAIRLALGERRASIGRRAVATAVVPTIVGVAGGSLVALAAGRWLESFLFEVSARDLPTMTLTAVGLVSLATLAAAGSAGRAARTDPMSALTQE